MTPQERFPTEIHCTRPAEGGYTIDRLGVFQWRRSNITGEWIRGSCSACGELHPSVPRRGPDAMKRPPRQPDATAAKPAKPRRRR